MFVVILFTWEQTSTKAASYLTVMARRWPLVMKPKINSSPSTRAKTQVLLFWTSSACSIYSTLFSSFFWVVSNSYKAYRKKFKQLLHVKFHRNNISRKPKKFATTNFCSCNSVVNILCTNLYVMYNLFTMNSWMYMWQSRVEIEGYSVSNFDHIAAFKAPYCWTSIKGRAYTRFVDAWISNKSTKRISAPPLMEDQSYGASNAVKRLKYATE